MVILPNTMHLHAQALAEACHQSSYPPISQDEDPLLVEHDLLDGALLVSDIVGPGRCGPVTSPYVCINLNCLKFIIWNYLL